MYYPGNDPFESAAAATLRPGAFFGQLSLLAEFCVLQRGVGRLLFDPQQHRIEARRTAIRLELAALPEHALERPLVRRLIAESHEWAGVVLPSIRQLGVKELRELHGAWVSLRLAPTGRTNVDASGATKAATTFQLVARYPHQAACRAAYQARCGGQG
jgi:hypothetical protein